MSIQHRRWSQLAEMLYCTRASCDCGRLPIGDVTREVKFLSNDYTNNNTNPKTLTTLILTITDPHGAFGSICAPAFCDFVRNYSCNVDGAVVTLNLINNWWVNSGVGLQDVEAAKLLKLLYSHIIIFGKH